MINNKNGLRVIVFCVVFGSVSFLYSSNPVLDKPSTSVGLASPSMKVKFTIIEDKILSHLAKVIANFNVGPKIAENYRALHQSLGEIMTFRKNKSIGTALKETYDAKFDALDEAMMCQSIITRLRARLGTNLFKDAHRESKRVHSVIEKILDARFSAANPGFKSHVMAFLKMPAEAIDAGIDKFFADIRTLPVLAQFLSELLALLEGMRAHLPGGEAILPNVVAPSALDLVNRKEESL